MKTKILTLLVITTVGSVFAQNIDIPDTHFKNYLLNNPLINTNGDNQVTVAEAEAFTGMINLDTYGDYSVRIYSLEGIQYFKNITSLYCFDKGRLKNIDLTQNTALEEIEIGFLNNQSAPFFVLDFQNQTALKKLKIKDEQNNAYTRISGIDLSTNTELTHLHIINLNKKQNNYGYVFDLDLSNNTKLEDVYISHSYFLNLLDLSQNVALKKLDLNKVYYKKNNGSFYYIDTLDVSNNVALEELKIYDTYLTSLDVSNCPALVTLQCPNNQLTSLDVSNCPALVTLQCPNNQLTVLNLKNGNNTNFVNCNFGLHNSYGASSGGNTDLKCIQVDDPNYSDANWKVVYSNGNIMYWSPNGSTYRTVCGAEFDPIGPFCIGATAPLLPAFSPNGFIGTWSPATIDTTTPGTTTYTFTKTSGGDSYSWTTATIKVKVNETPAPPTFTNIDLPVVYCLGATPPSLPTTSSNGIAGTWSPSVINTATYGDQIYTFTPNAPCSVPHEVEINVQQNTMISPVGSPTQTFTAGQTLADLQVTYTNTLEWYGNATLTVLLPATTPLVNYATYYAVSTNGVCKSEVLAITVQQTSDCSSVVSTPTGATTQTFTTGQTIADLVVNGDNLVWYSDSSLTTILPTTTTLVDQTTYYVVEEVGNCQSDPLIITAIQTVNVSSFDMYGFRYHPNPVNDILHFSSNTTIENVLVTNMLGQQINVSLSSDNKSLDMSNLPSGNYFVKVTIEGVAKKIKVVKR